MHPIAPPPLFRPRQPTKASTDKNHILCILNMPRDKALIRTLPGAFLKNPNDHDSPIYLVTEATDKRITVREVGGPTEKAFTPKSLTHLVGSIGPNRGYPCPAVDGDGQSANSRG